MSVDTGILDSSRAHCPPHVPSVEGRSLPCFLFAHNSSLPPSLFVSVFGDASMR